jgi:hypothetical protein
LVGIFNIRVFWDVGAKAVFQIRKLLGHPDSDQAKIGRNPFFLPLVISLIFFSLKNKVNVPSKSNKKKNKELFFAS